MARGVSEESLFYKDQSKKKIYKGQNQKYPILQGGKTLLTLNIIKKS